MSGHMPLAYNLPFNELLRQHSVSPAPSDAASQPLGMALLLDPELRDVIARNLGTFLVHTSS
jgi:hypothetical protein